jgi:superfamily II DNA or RNA helicase
MNIEKYLVLNKYLLSLFGVEDFRKLREGLRDAPVNIDSDGRTHFVNILRSSFEGLRRDVIPEETLLGYDEQIQQYVRSINSKREPISLKYFQYLAVLFIEIVLDNLKKRKLEFLHDVNEFLRSYKQQDGVSLVDKFGDTDLNKLALWMATGSGKTLITHINYHQFFNYKLFSPDNIILITPNAGLSKQHFDELQKSGIPSRRYEGELSSYGLFRDEQEVLIIEMTKFVEEKKGGGVTLPVDVFEGRNLVFVDEGHKGKRSEEQKWAKLRDRLADKGFVFEYSATFGQILSESNEETLREYAKSIIIDYSYKHFYLDGYGKDFSVLNVKQANVSEKNFQETMFVANLLSIYEQLLVYEENKIMAEEHNLEKPLWIFVGTTVTGKEEESDVVQIVEFIKRVMQDDEWVRKKAKDILSEDTPLKDDNNEDMFKNRFGYLKKKGVDFDDLYNTVFRGRGGLNIYELKNAEGEFGLKISENAYFGVINIGDVSGFERQLGKKGISVEKDAVSGSLFDAIKKEDSTINILIGSKKFIEGWDTWRVSSMGLLNIGTGQGPQIIQLFGRGIRLKGKEMSLKRSGDTGPVHFLEMLNIYGIKADYLRKFLEAIDKEEVEFETIEIPIKPQYEGKWKTLYTLTKDEMQRFEEQEVLHFGIDDSISSFAVDLLPKVATYLAKEREEKGIDIKQVKADVQAIRLEDGIVALLDWDRILQEIYDYKIVKGYWNLVFDSQGLENLLLSDRYEILALPDVFAIGTGDDVRRVEDVAMLVIKKYIDIFYRKYAKRFETENLRYATVGKQLALSIFEKPGKKYSYTVQINKKEKELIEEVNRLAKDLNRLLKEDSKTLPRIYFDKHLYVPILLQSKRIDRISPVGLVDSEKDFIEGLKQFLKKNESRFADLEVYVLRNYPKAGVGFFNLSGFYPDFIMWVKDGKKQTMVFIDPKGLEHTKGLDDEKVKLADDIKELEQKLGDQNVILESFILSGTSYPKWIEGRTAPPSKDECISHHVLFLEPEDWPDRLFAYLK